MANGSGAWTYTTAALANGAHSLTATATDAAGNTGVASSALSVTIDTTAPVAPSITSFTPDTGTAGDGITTANVLTLTGTAEANSTVKVFDGATLLGSAVANASGAWTYTTAALANGAHSLTATATDAAGNTGVASAALAVTVMAPPGAPVITSFSPDTGVVGDGITDPAILTLTGTAVANSTVNVYDGTTLLGTATANASGAWNFVTAPLPDGLHKFTATDTVSGITSAASAVMNVTVDTVAPAAPSIASFSTDSGKKGDGITNDTTLTLTGTAEANSTVKVFDGATLLGSAVANGSGAWTYMTGTLAEGAHTFTSTAADAAGNTSGASAGLTVTIDTKKPNAPILASDAVLSTNQVLLTGTADANSTVNVSDGATLLGTAAADGTGTWNFTTNALSDGAHAFTATATDAAGNTSVVSQALDPLVGTPISIELNGATTLGELANHFYLNDSTGSGPSLQYGGADYVAGQYGAWTPFAAEKTATGYEVAWKFGNADLYTVWTTDNNGNYVSNTAAVSGTNATLESLETSFNQDLNDDGQIGIPKTVLESNGATSLTAMANHYYMFDSTGSGPSLKYRRSGLCGGSISAPGRRLPRRRRRPAMRLPGSMATPTCIRCGRLTTTATTSQIPRPCRAPIRRWNPWRPVSIRISISDGQIGIPKTVIESNGATSLTEMANHYYLYDSTGSGPSLKFGGADYVAGQYGAWTPFAAEKTATGYEVAWKYGNADIYTVWTTDNSGNYVSNTPAVSGTSTTLESTEPSFNQDLNHDGYVGVVLNGASGAQTLNATGGTTTLIGGPNDVLNGGAGADTFVFPANFGSNTVNNFTPGTDALQFSHSMFATVAAVLNDAQQVGSNVVITHDPQNVVTLHNTQLSNLHASDIHIV